jgi:hypothetical protein
MHFPRPDGFGGSRRGAEHEVAGNLALPRIYRRRLDVSLRAFVEYQPSVYQGDVLLLACKVRPLFHRSERDLGWSRWIDGSLTVRVLPGDHDDLFQEPHIRRVAAEIIALVDRVKVRKTAEIRSRATGTDSGENEGSCLLVSHRPERPRGRPDRPMN